MAQQTCNNNFRAHIRLPRTLQQCIRSFPLGIYAGNYNELVDNYTFVPSTYRSKWIGRFVGQVVEFLEALSVMKLSAIKLISNQYCSTVMIKVSEKEFFDISESA